MRWDDERYVRVYTRDTEEWISWSPEARSVAIHLLRVADRAGIVKYRSRDGLASLMRLPLSWVEKALPELDDSAFVTLSPGSLTIRNFLTAQESPRSDVERKRQQRERDRDAAMDSSLQDVTSVTGRVKGVTNVTPFRAVPSVPNLPLSGKPDHVVVDRIFEAYQSHHPRSRLDVGKRKAILKALETQVEDACIAAIHGNHLDPHCCGQNEQRRAFHDLGLILRDDDHIVRYAEVYEKHSTRPTPRLLICQKCHERSHEGDCAAVEATP